MEQRLEGTAVWRHSHAFDEGNPLAEKNTLRVVMLTAAMMVVEITAGWWLNSMALLADGWHMSSHALALGLSVLAYVLARRLSDDRRFAFGTWKIEVLGGYTSAVLLGAVAALILFESVSRLISPQPIQYDQAIVIAAIGLLVNLTSAWLLHDHHDHEHEDHAEHLHHHDINLRSAFVHVLADAATSVLAILALVGGKFWGASWLDPVMGIAGAVLVAVWAKGLLRDSGKVLLDAEMDSPAVSRVRDAVALEFGEVEICDLHLWRVGKHHYACIVSVATRSGVSPDAIKRALSRHTELVHMTVEVNPMPA